MSAAKRLLGVCGLAVGALVLVGGVLGQELQEVTTPDGRTIKVPANVPAHVLERIRSGSGPHMSRPEPGKPDEPQEGKDEEPDEEEKEKEKEEDKEKEEEGNKDEEKPEEAPEPVKRESTPPEPADPEELKVRPDEKGMVRFNFVGQKWLGVLEWLAVISDMSLDWQELPGDYLNLTTQRAYTVRETRDLINRHLLARGYTLLSQGEVLSVVKIDKLDPGLVPRVSPEELDDRDPHEYVKVSFSLDWLLAETAVEELKPMLSPNGKLTALKATNRLEAMDAVANLRQIHQVLGEEQSGSGQERLVRKFELNHTLAEDVLRQLEALLGIESKSKAAAQPMTPDQMRAHQEAMMRAKQQAQKGKPGPPAKPKAEVFLVANKRENSILAHAPPDKMAIIEEAVTALDVPSDHAHSLLRNMERMQVYRLESIEPEALIKTLEELGELDFDTRLEADKENKAIIAYASLADHLTIRSLIEKLDGGGRRAEVIQLVTLRAESVAKIIDFMMGGGKEEEEDRSRSGRSFFPWFGYRSSSSRRGSEEHTDTFRVDADVKNNTLLLWCNEFELAKVQDLLERLRENRLEGDAPNTVEVHRLATLDPEPFVKTLEDMETLAFNTKLEVDEENNSIIAYASEADHAKIRDLIGKLDGSSREFHVIPLRRLEADYVAGTVAFMMAGKEDTQQSGYSRTYVYNEYYGGGPSRDGGREKKPDEFRVDADVEYNRLLLWANEIEVEEVMNLLVKLGEIPPEGGDPSTVRVLDVSPGPERDKLLERIQRIWPSLAPNQLLLPGREESEGDEDKENKTDPEQPQERLTPAESRPTTAAGGPGPPTAPKANSPLSGNTRAADAEPERAVFLFAQLEEQPASSAGSGAEAAETAPKSDEPPPTAAPTEGQPKPPVSITQAPDGRLIITSEDTQALDRLEELVGRLAPPRRDYEVFHLKYAEAYWVKWNLEDFFQEEEKDDRGSSRRHDWYWGYPPSSGTKEPARRLSRRRPLKFISDDDTNTILVQGATPEQLRTIEELIMLYDQPPATDSDSARKTEVFAIRYSKASVVAEAVKDVYRDLLSDRDKSLVNRNQQQRPESRYTYIFDEGGDTERKTPKFKGYLSIGIDELSNTLIVSAPEFLFRDIAKIVEELDEAAKPTDTVQVRQLGRGVSASVVQETLSKVLAEAASGGKPSGKPEGEKPGGGGPKRPGQPRVHATD